jgi:hypothetical protein
VAELWRIPSKKQSRLAANASPTPEVTVICSKLLDVELVVVMQQSKLMNLAQRTSQFNLRLRNSRKSITMEFKLA